MDDCEGAHKAVKAFDLEKDVKALKNKRVEIGKGTEAEQTKNTKLDKSKKHQSNEVETEIEATEFDLNYNVKVSNSFSPLLQIVQEKASSAAAQASYNDLQITPLSPSPSPVSRDSVQLCNSPKIPSGTPPSPRTPSGSPGHHASASESPKTPEQKSEADEEETVYFEGNLISKQEAFKKILEAVQDMNRNFNP